MIDETLLRDDLIRLLTATENNIRTRCEEEPAINRPLEDRYEAACQAGRTSMTFSTWREGEITQAGVAWLLACVFVRFLEDNDLLGQVYLAGPGGRLKNANDRRTAWYRGHSTSSDRDYLLDIFSELEHLPGLKGLLDRTHNPLWSLGPDGDGAKAIWDFFQTVDPDTQLLRHDFTDTAQSTRFLGDLYQNISESARKRYALLQTPDFIVDFILDRTLTPAVEEFPLDGFRLIDPACGSGHFLLEAFDRLFRLWANREGDLSKVAEKTLSCVYGVDLNPYAAAIARFRLLIASLKVCGIATLDHAPDWQIHVISGDSLLFGPNKMVPSLACLPAEDPEQLRLLLQTQGYHVVVGNPPYISVQDAQLRSKYRNLYRSCSGVYQLSVPFTECLFDLAEGQGGSGYVGMITSNAFMKRAFGKKLIEDVLPKLDLTHVIDTSGVYLPGHGTPTAILIARKRQPVGRHVRLVRSVKGEISQPQDPANAPVWTEIRTHVDVAPFEGTFCSVGNVDRESLNLYPWSIGGGGASELKERLDDASPNRIQARIGGAVRMGLEEAFICSAPRRRHSRLMSELFREYLIGENVRDWSARIGDYVLYPYPDTNVASIKRFLWPYRSALAKRATFQGVMADAGLQWYEYMQHTPFAYATPLSIAFAFVSTNNHFVLDRGGRVFNRSAPVIKLDGSNAERDYLTALAILNSSAAGFWLRQVCYPKGGNHVGGDGARTRPVLWDVYYEYDAANISQLPFPDGSPLELTTEIQAAADERSTLLPAVHVANRVPTRASLDSARNRSHALLLRMIALQEELDWRVYYLYHLLDESLTLPLNQIPPVQLGERAFEILMARAVDAGGLETEWFKRHSSTPITEIPNHWPAFYRTVVQQRLDVIARDRDIGLIEQPEYKRRWNLPSWEELEQDALRNWLLDRLEDSRYWPTNPPALTSVARLADAVRTDAEFVQVAELYRGRPDFDFTDLVQELVARESVPFLPRLRYKESGLRKRTDWERTWEFQRREDEGEKVEIPAPPKYERVDFLADCWRLRGKLDVPKERWISYPYLERDADKSQVIAWAAYDHGQQALALAGYANEMRTNDGWTADRLTPVLAGLEELQPWLDQWHNEIDSDRQQRLNESIRTFTESEMTQLGITTEKLREWRPPARSSATKTRKARPRTTAASESPASTE